MAPRERAVIRRAEARDGDAWGAMRARLWPEEFDGGTMTAEAHAFLAGDRATIEAAFVAVDAAGTPCGFIEASIRPYSDGCESMPVPHVEGWYVEPGSRGRGLGRGLMDAVTAWARERGFTELASDTELHNVASLHAHTACGFTDVERLIKFRKAL